MRVKLDENLGSLGATFLRGHDVEVVTVADQGLQGAPDEKILQVCVSEGLCVVTLDLDFSNPLKYPPADSAGSVVVRLPAGFRVALLERALGLMVEASKVADVRGHLWIAEVDRLREHLEEPER